MLVMAIWDSTTKLIPANISGYTVVTLMYIHPSQLLYTTSSYSQKYAYHIFCCLGWARLEWSLHSLMWLVTCQMKALKGTLGYHVVVVAHA